MTFRADTPPTDAGESRTLVRDWVLVCGILAMLTAIYFNEYLFKGKVVYESDSLLVSYATRYYAVSELQQGRIPHWNHYYYLGYPFLAEGQAGVFDPFTLVMVLFPLSWFSWLYHFLLAVRFFLIGVFTFGWLRTETGDSRVSLLGALILPFSGFFISHIFHPHLIGVVGWTPLLLWLWRMREKNPARRIAAEAGFILVSAWQVLMGHFPGLALSWSAVGFMVLFQGFADIIRTESLNGLVSPLYTLLRMWFYTALLTAFQWLPTVSAARDTGRALIPPVNEGFLLLHQWALLLKPTLLGDFYYEKGGYIGLFPLACLAGMSLALAVPQWRMVVPRGAVIYGALALWFLSFTLGPNSFFYSGLSQIPPFSLLRYPSRYLADFGIFGVGAVCIFLSALLRQYPRMAMLIPLLIALSTADVFAKAYGYTIPAPREVVDREPERIQTIRKFVGPGQRALSAGFKYYQTYRYPEFLQEEPSEGLVPSEILSFFTANRYRYSQISFFQQTTLLQRRYIGFINELQLKPRTEFLDFLGVTVIVSPPEHRITALQSEDYRLVHTSSSGYAALRVRNQQVHKARYVTQSIVVQPEKQARFVQRGWFGVKKVYLSRDKNILDYLLSSRFDPSDQVLFDAPIPATLPEELPANLPPGSPCKRQEVIPAGEILWIADGGGVLELCVHAPTPGYLIVAEQYHRNWRARDNGTPVPVLRGNYLFLVVPLPAGLHEIKFQFVPLEFRVGMALLVFGGLLFLWSYILVPSLHPPSD
ncbi:MAG: hypothetical protein V2G42_04315 [bacterium JZ-2024 1]